jgi:hypothetical protein
LRNHARFPQHFPGAPPANLPWYGFFPSISYVFFPYCFFNVRVLNDAAPVAGLINKFNQIVEIQLANQFNGYVEGTFPLAVGYPFPVLFLTFHEVTNDEIEKGIYTC